MVASNSGLRPPPPPPLPPAAAESAFSGEPESEPVPPTIPMRSRTGSGVGNRARSRSRLRSGQRLSGSSPVTPSGTPSGTPSASPAAVSPAVTDQSDGTSGSKSGTDGVADGVDSVPDGGRDGVRDGVRDGDKEESEIDLETGMPHLQQRVFRRYMPFAVSERFMRRPRPLQQCEWESFTSAVAFVDISGFTKLSEALAKEFGSNGAEKLNDFISGYFEKLIAVIHLHGGDIIKFAGDAMLVVWRNPILQQHTPTALRRRTAGAPSASGLVAAGSSAVAAFGTQVGKKRGHMPQRELILRAAQCNLDLIKHLDPYSVPGTEVKLRLHTGIAHGSLLGMYVGGAKGVWEFFVAGSPIEYMSDAGDEAVSGQVVLHKSTYAIIRDVAHGRKLPSGNFWIKSLDDLGLAPWRHRSPPLPLALEPMLEGFVPPVIRDYCRRQMERATTTESDTAWFAEYRKATIIFVVLTGMDYSQGDRVIRQQLQPAVRIVQEVVQKYEGFVARLLADDKGTRFKIVFGMPGLVHENDGSRAVLTSIEITERLRSELHMNPSIGVAAGMVFCGEAGSRDRCEYTAVGFKVIMAARLMQKAEQLGGGVILENEVKKSTRGDATIDYHALPPVALKGVAEPVPIFRPLKKTSKNAKALAMMGLAPSDQQQHRLQKLSTVTMDMGSSKDSVASKREGLLKFIKGGMFKLRSVRKERRPGGMAAAAASQPASSQSPGHSSQSTPNKDGGKAENVAALPRRINLDEEDSKEAVEDAIRADASKSTSASGTTSSSVGSGGGRRRRRGALQLPPASPAPGQSEAADSGASIGGLTGRAQELKQITERLHEVMSQCTRSLELRSRLLSSATARANEEAARAAAAEFDTPAAVILVTGDAGIGKSALTFASMARAEQIGFDVCFGTGVPLERGNAYFPWRAILLKALRLTEERRGDVRRAKVLSLLNPELHPLAELLNPLLDTQFPVTEMIERMVRMADDSVARNTRKLVVNLLANLSKHENRQAPLCLVLEDLHFCDTASLQLLLEVCLMIPGILVLGSCRPVQSAFQLGSKPRALLDQLVSLPSEHKTMRLELHPLSQSDALALAQLRLGVRQLPRRLVDVLKEKAQGLPLYVEELVAAMVDQGLVVVQNTECFLRDGVSDEELRGAFPDSVHDLLVSRIDRLPREIQLTLKVFCLIGMDRVRLPLLIAAHPQVPKPTERELLAQLEELEAQGFLGRASRDDDETMSLSTVGTTHEDESTTLVYTLRHDLLRSVASSLLTLEQRQRIHLAVAQFWEKNYPRQEKYYGFLAHHWQEAGNKQHALIWAQLAGDRAVAQNTNTEALSFLGTALHLLLEIVAERSEAQRVTFARSDQDQERRLRVSLGTACYALGRYREAISHLRRALQLLGSPVSDSAKSNWRDMAMLRLRARRSTTDATAEVESEGNGDLLSLTVRVQESLLLSAIQVGDRRLAGAAAFAMLDAAERLGSLSAKSLAYAHGAYVSLILQQERLAKTLRRWTLATIAQPDFEKLDQLERARSIHQSTMSAGAHGEWDACITALQFAKELFKARQEHKKWRECTFLLGVSFHMACRWQQAVKYLAKLAKAAREDGDLFIEVQALLWLGYTRFILEGPSQAIADYVTQAKSALGMAFVGDHEENDEKGSSTVAIVTLALRVLSAYNAWLLLPSDPSSEVVLALIEEVTALAQRLAPDAVGASLLWYDMYPYLWTGEMLLDMNVSTRVCKIYGGKKSVKQLKLVEKCDHLYKSVKKMSTCFPCFRAMSHTLRGRYYAVKENHRSARRHIDQSLTHARRMKMMYAEFIAMHELARTVKGEAECRRNLIEALALAKRAGVSYWRNPHFALIRSVDTRTVKERASVTQSTRKLWSRRFSEGDEDKGDQEKRRRKEPRARTAVQTPVQSPTPAAVMNLPMERVKMVTRHLRDDSFIARRDKATPVSQDPRNEAAKEKERAETFARLVAQSQGEDVMLEEEDLTQPATVAFETDEEEETPQLEESILVERPVGRRMSVRFASKTGGAATAVLSASRRTSRRWSVLSSASTASVADSDADEEEEALATSLGWLSTSQLLRQHSLRHALLQSVSGHSVSGHSVGGHGGRLDSVGAHVASAHVTAVPLAGDHCTPLELDELVVDDDGCVVPEEPPRYAPPPVRFGRSGVICDAFGDAVDDVTRETRVPISALLAVYDVPERLPAMPWFRPPRVGAAGDERRRPPPPPIERSGTLSPRALRRTAALTFD